MDDLNEIDARENEAYWHQRNRKRGANLYRAILHRITCVVCGETDGSVTLRCRDTVTRCAHHANEAGWCWGCGDNTPVFNGDEDSDGLCHDCRAADEMRWRVIRRFA